MKTAIRRISKRMKELRGKLRKIRDSHPKLILTLDDDPTDNIDGIRKLNVLDWLLQ